jgi:branched-chain amino acid transport system ATP-binding protein
VTGLLELVGLDAGYGRSAVVRGLDLSVGEGEVVALLGANGAGKTTTLLTASGLLRPLAGQVRFRGRSVGGTAPDRLARDGLCHVPDDRGLFPGLRVDDHFALARAGAADRALVDEWFPALAPLGRRRSGLLSGGEQQMLALALALIRRPAVLLIDELSLGLAPMVAASLVPSLRRLADEQGCGVLVVEQHADLILSVADRAALLVHGELALEGPVEVLRREQEALVAGYLGRSPDLPSDE